jgi:hypothetical protein
VSIPGSVADHLWVSGEVYERLNNSCRLAVLDVERNRLLSFAMNTIFMAENLPELREELRYCE